MPTSVSWARPARLVAGLTVLGVAAAAGVWLWRDRARPAPLAHGALAGANVLLVTIDTLRADRVGAYGGGGLTPVMDGLAARGARFTRAYAHVPLTLPSHASILTGLPPPAHGVRDNGLFRLDPRTPTLAARLGAAGYRTGAFVGAFVLDRRFGLARGFDVYDDLYRESRNRSDFAFDERRAPDVLRPAADWIVEGRAEDAARLSAARAGAGAPWFAWVHLFDPHAPYDAPPGGAGVTPYDREVAYTDASLAPFFGRLQRAGQLDRTLVILTADHGEGLGDHGEATHGLFAYDSTLRVPLIVAGPGIGASVQDALVAHMDLVPTVLDFLGLDAAPELPGRSLRTVIDGEAPPPRAIYFEALDANLTRHWAPLTGAIRGDWKYIDLPIEELYDLRHDAAETKNLAAAEPGERSGMQAALRELRRRLSTAGPAAPQMVDAETEARLRALGYTGAAPGGPPPDTYGGRDDPKGLVDLDRRCTGALARAGAGELDQAAADLEGVIAERPDFLAAYTTAASVLIQAGRPEAAVALLRTARARGLESPQLADRLGAAALAAGRPADAAAALEPAAAAPSAGVDTLNTLGVAYAQLGRAADARALFDRVVAIDPKSPGTWNNVGLLELRANRPAEAAAAFRRAIAADPTYAAAWQGLGAALLDTDRAAAIDAWVRAVDLVPDDYDTLFNVGVLLAQSSEPARALPYLRRFADAAPPARYAADIARVRQTIAAIERGGR